MDSCRPKAMSAPRTRPIRRVPLITWSRGLVWIRLGHGWTGVLVRLDPDHGAARPIGSAHTVVPFAVVAGHALTWRGVEFGQVAVPGALVAVQDVWITTRAATAWDTEALAVRVGSLIHVVWVRLTIAFGAGRRCPLAWCSTCRPTEWSSTRPSRRRSATIECGSMRLPDDLVCAAVDRALRHLPDSEVTAADIADHLGLPIDRATHRSMVRVLNSMTRRNLLKRVGPRRLARWTLLDTGRDLVSAGAPRLAQIEAPTTATGEPGNTQTATTAQHARPVLDGLASASHRQADQAPHPQHGRRHTRPARTARTG